MPRSLPGAGEVAPRADAFITDRKARARCQRTSQMRWLARRHAPEILKRQAGGTFWTSKGMGPACEPQRWSREHAQQRDAIPMDQNLGELPASCAPTQKNAKRTQ